ncbi:O-methyltransferase-domain-containing protein [Suillus lakei]|nr:O-methyltransferase-domain-containing protein [Suillus lakei]
MSGELKNLIQSPLDKRMDEGYTAYSVVCTDTLIKTGIIDYLSNVPNPSQGVRPLNWPQDLDLILESSSTFSVTMQQTMFTHFHQRSCRSGTGCFYVSVYVGDTNRTTLGDGIRLETIAFPSADRFSDRVQDSLAPILLAWAEWTWRHLSNYVQINMSTPSVVADYPWETLETSVFLIFLRSFNHDRHPCLRAVVQDLENVVALRSSIMQERRPRDLESGKFKAEVHDFFQPQPRIGNEYCFILRHVLHDWPDKEAAAILGNVARALGPKSQILIIDMLAVPNVDSTATTSTKSFLLDNDAKRSDYSIASHFGSASTLTSGFSVDMMSVMNGCEKSLREWETLVKGCGLRVTNVYLLRAHPSII